MRPKLGCASAPRRGRSEPLDQLPVLSGLPKAPGGDWTFGHGRRIARYAHRTGPGGTPWLRSPRARAEPDRGRSCAGFMRPQMPGAPGQRRQSTGWTDGHSRRAAIAGPQRTPTTFASTHCRMSSQACAPLFEDGRMLAKQSLQLVGEPRGEGAAPAALSRPRRWWARSATCDLLAAEVSTRARRRRLPVPGHSGAHQVLRVGVESWNRTSSSRESSNGLVGRSRRVCRRCRNARTQALEHVSLLAFLGV